MPIQRKYRFRNLPCTITDPPYYVAGTDNIGHGAGVLEWCYDQKDAEQVLETMQTSGEFADLIVGQQVHTS